MLIPRSAPYPASVLLFSLQLSPADVSQDVLLSLAFSLIKPIRSSGYMLEGRKDGLHLPQVSSLFWASLPLWFHLPLQASPLSWAPFPTRQTLFLYSEVTLPLPSDNPVSSTVAAPCCSRSPNALLDCSLVSQLPVLLVTSSSH